MQRASYKSDLTDQEWAEIAPFLERRDKRGRKQKYELREIANAIYYVIVTGAQWRNIPHDFPPWDSVYWHFRKWKKNEAIKDLHSHVRKQLRIKLGRHPDPSAGVIDSQTVKSTIGGESIGYDGNKKVKGRKRHLIVDTLGLIIALTIHSADLVDGNASEIVFAHKDIPERLELVWADKGYSGDRVRNFGLKNGIRVEVVGNPSKNTFVVAKKRWLVERTNAWTSSVRRLTKDHERTISSSETLIFTRFSRLMINWLIKGAIS